MSFRTKIRRIGYAGTSRQVFLFRYVAVLDVLVFFSGAEAPCLVFGQQENSTSKTTKQPSFSQP
jgi:hypothetical protein